MNKDHAKSLIEQIEFGIARGHDCEHSQKELKRLKGFLSEDVREPESWADKVNACKSKKELETLVLEDKKIDIDKRKKLKDLKADALAL